MIKFKSSKEIDIMKQGGIKLRNVTKDLVKLVKPGISTKWIDNKAEDMIRATGGESSFKKVPGYHWTTCLPINEQVVHTPPSDRVLKDGDLLTIDIGMYFKGFHTDYATSLIVGKNENQKIDKFLKIGEDTLYKAINQAKSRNRLGQISKTIEDEIYGNGYFILKELTGHGIGRDLHEDPFILGFLDRPIDKTIKIQPGLVIAIEVIYSMGSEKITHEKGDKWSIMTDDRSLSACFEHTIAITDTNTIILT